MIDRKDWPEDARNAQDAFDEASWDAIETYRDTGEMVPSIKDGKLHLYTVDEAMRTRSDYEMRKKDVVEWRSNSLIAQVKLAGIDFASDVWERPTADCRQAHQGDFAWIHP